MTYRWLGTVCQISRGRKAPRSKLQKICLSAKSVRVAKSFGVSQNRSII
nr:MAG TPA: hypothetical protein [Caudoviricetes sp.]